MRHSSKSRSHKVSTKQSLPPSPSSNGSSERCRRKLEVSRQIRVIGDTCYRVRQRLRSKLSLLDFDGEVREERQPWETSCSQTWMTHWKKPRRYRRPSSTKKKNRKKRRSKKLKRKLKKLKKKRHRYKQDHSSSCVPGFTCPVPSSYPPRSSLVMRRQSPLRQLPLIPGPGIQCTDTSPSPYTCDTGTDKFSTRGHPPGSILVS